MERPSILKSRHAHLMRPQTRDRLIGIHTLYEDRFLQQNALVPGPPEPVAARSVVLKVQRLHTELFCQPADRGIKHTVVWPCRQVSLSRSLGVLSRARAILRPGRAIRVSLSKACHSEHQF